ncbi:MAG: hypothetical protein AAGJ40_15895 [Planctomycetota bacterium]
MRQKITINASFNEHRNDVEVSMGYSLFGYANSGGDGSKNY